MKSRLHSNIFYFIVQSILMSNDFSPTTLWKYNTKADCCPQRWKRKKVLFIDMKGKCMNSFIPIWKPWFDGLICRRNMKPGLDFWKVQCSQEHIRSGIFWVMTSQKWLNFFLSWIRTTTVLWISVDSHDSKAKDHDEIMFEKHSNAGKNW